MGLDHAQARKDATEGFTRKFGRPPTLPEVQLLQAVGMLETSYGLGWKGAGRGSFNMGAITAGPSWKGATFEYRDSYPDSNGVDHWYTTKFRAYPDAVAGWEDLANIMYEDRPSVLKAASAGDSYGVSAALYETTYYKGRGKTAAERIAGHHKAVMNALLAQCKALGEHLPNGEDVPPPTIQLGSQGEAVKDLQRWAGLVADGIFGPIVDRWVRDFQSDHNLKADGVVGPITWAKLEEVFATPAPATQVGVSVEDLLAHLVVKATDFRGHLDEFVAAARSVKA